MNTDAKPSMDAMRQMKTMVETTELPTNWAFSGVPERKQQIRVSQTVQISMMDSMQPCSAGLNLFKIDIKTYSFSKDISPNSAR